MTSFICTTCGTEFAATGDPPGRCPICEDERQYVDPSGQQWTTPEALRQDHTNTVQTEEPGLTGIGTEPKFAIGQRALLSGDIIQVVADRRFVSFMYSYPNLIPLPTSAVQRITKAVAPFGYERLYGAWFGSVVTREAQAAVARSAQRYIRAITGRSS